MGCAMLEILVPAFQCRIQIRTRVHLCLCLWTGLSLPAALHPVSRRRSCLRLRTDQCFCPIGTFTLLLVRTFRRTSVNRFAAKSEETRSSSRSPVRLKVSQWIAIAMDQQLSLGLTPAGYSMMYVPRLPPATSICGPLRSVAQSSGVTADGSGPRNLGFFRRLVQPKYRI